MIRDVGGVTRVLDRDLGGAGKGPLSLVRIVVWMLVGLIGIGLVYHAPAVKLSKTIYNKKITNPYVRDVTLDYNDPRGFVHLKHKNAFTIAWIGASTLQSIEPGRYTFLPSDVQELLPKVDGKQVYVDMYFMSGARTFDLYAATQAAIASGADMIVISLNPVWLFNDSAIQGWPNLNGVTAVNTLKSPSNWPLDASLLSPSDAVLGEVSRFIPSINNRWSYAQSLNRKVAKLSPLNTSHPPKPPKHPSQLQQISAMSVALSFWAKYRPGTSKGTSVTDRELAFLAGGDPGKDSYNKVIVNQMFKSLKAYNKPVILYVDAIETSAMKNPAIDAQLTRIENEVRAISEKYQSPNMYVHWQSVGRDVTGLKFDDIVHLADDRPLAVYLAGQVCQQLVATGTTPTCEPKKVALK